MERKRERQRHRQREMEAPCRDPNVGLDLGSPGSHTGPKAGTNPLSHPGFPVNLNLKTDAVYVLESFLVCLEQYV